MASRLERDERNTGKSRSHRNVTDVRM